MMTETEITKNIDDLQTQLNIQSQNLIRNDPLCQSLIGKISAYNDVLSEKKEEKKEEA